MIPKAVEEFIKHEVEKEHIMFLDKIAFEWTAEMLLTQLEVKK